MRQYIATLFAIFLCCTTVKAQSIVEHLQKDEQGKGKITVKHSKEIDNLVNGKSTVEVTPVAPKKQDVTPKKQETTPTKQDVTPKKQEEKKTEKKVEPTTIHKTDSTIANKERSNEKKNDEPAHETKRDVVRHTSTPTESESETRTIDTRKKVMRNAQKITGYRVQVYSGGSSRQDRQKAQEASNKVKAKFPDLPVYVHFYSPSWKCRVGNFRTYNEANKVLKQIKALGYSQACIVKGKITVQ